jgi:hypothetical protein
MLNITVAEVRLQRPRVMAGIGEGEATGVAQHVGVGLEIEPSLGAGALDHLGKAGRRERRAAFADEHIGRRGALALQPAQGAQLVAAQRVF